MEEWGGIGRPADRSADWPIAGGAVIPLGGTALRAIGYIRVSTEEQARDGVSLDAQSAKIRGYCALHEIELVDLVVDAGVSAKSLARPGLESALTMLDDRQA